MNKREKRSVMELIIATAPFVAGALIAANSNKYWGDELAQWFIFGAVTAFVVSCWIFERGLRKRGKI